MLRLLATTAAVLGLLAQGCSTSCDGVSDTPIEFSDGITNAARTEYQTAPWDGRYLSFPPKRRYDLIHGLYTTPVHIDSYLGFTPEPLGNDEDSVAETAGNMVVIEDVNETFIRVANDTCQHFYLRVVAGVAPEATTPNGEGGAAGIGGAPEAGAAGIGGAPEAGAAGIGGAP